LVKLDAIYPSSTPKASLSGSQTRTLCKDIRLRIVRAYILLDYPVQNLANAGDIQNTQTELQRVRVAWLNNNFTHFGGAKTKTEALNYIFAEDKVERIIHGP
jgi:hypothetical protein